MTVRNTHFHRYNYTGRKLISQRKDLFSISAISELEGTYEFSVVWDTEKLSKILNVNDVPFDIVLDVLNLGRLYRYVLDKSQKSEEFKLTEFAEGSSIRARLKLVATGQENRGVILAASRFSRLTKLDFDEEGDNSKKRGILNFNLVDNLEGQIYEIVWSEPENPYINMNRNFYQKFKSDQPTTAAFIYPKIVREIAIGLLFREIDFSVISKKSAAMDWLNFFEARLSMDDFISTTMKPETEKFEYAEKIEATFCNRKWRNGHTLLEEIL